MFKKIGQEWANDSFVTFTTEIEIQQRGLNKPDSMFQVIE